MTGPSRLADLVWLLRRARPAPARLVLAALAGAGATGSAVALLATSAWLISAAALHPPVLTLAVAVVAVRAFGLARGVLRYGERLVSHDVALRATSRLRVATYRELERLVPAHLGARSGDVLRRLVSDVEAVQDLLVRVLLPVAGTLVVALATVGLLLWLLPAAGLAVLGALVLALVAVPLLTTGLAARAERAQAEAAGALSAQVVDVLRGAAELVAYGAAPAALAELAATDDRLTALRRRAALGAGAGTGLAVAAGGLAVLACLLVGVPAVRAGSLDGVRLAVLVLTPLALWEAVAALPPALQRLPGLAAAAARLRGLTAGECGVVWEHPAPLTSTFVARGLGLRWPGCATDVVAGLDLDLRAGRTLALTGPSGSGKSTVVAALLRFLDPSAGELRCGGVDVRRLDPDQVRGRIAWCGPDAHLFDTTVRQNLLLARPDATEDELRDALRGARVEDWVRAQPDGLDTAVGEHGARLSGGERQRLALARALLADRPVLVLDEPTAHLDQPTARALGADLAAAARTRTTLLISHAPELIAEADDVLRLDREAITRSTAREAVA